MTRPTETENGRGALYKTRLGRGSGIPQDVNLGHDLPVTDFSCFVLVNHAKQIVPISGKGRFSRRDGADLFPVPASTLVSRSHSRSGSYRKAIESRFHELILITARLRSTSSCSEKTREASV